MDYTEEIQLRAYGPIILGTSNCKWSEPSGPKEVKYKIFGLYRDRILAASYRTYDGISADRGVFIISFDLEGVAATGQITGYEGPNYSKLESAVYSWTKISR